MREQVKVYLAYLSIVIFGLGFTFMFGFGALGLTVKDSRAAIVTAALFIGFLGGWATGYIMRAGAEEV